MVAPLIALVLALPGDVAIRYANPDAKKVEIAGDLNGWSNPQPMRKEDGTWVFRRDLPEDARFEYKFVVDGNWILDPANPKKNDNGVGGENSVWEGPQYRFHGLEGKPKHPMRRSTLTVGGREIIVFAPENAKGLPLLVYGDGPNYEKYGRIQNVVMNLFENGDIDRPVILGLVPPRNRFQEYGVGWKAYGAYLLDEVVPAIRKATGASEKAKDLYVGGSSMGGLISLRLAEEFPGQVAGGVHAQSGAFVRMQNGPDFAETILPAALKKIAKGTKVWLCWGAFEGELTEGNVAAAKAIGALDLPYRTMATNEGHNWTAWRNRMAAGLKFLLGPK